MRGARPTALGDRPLYFVSSNTHSLANLLTRLPRAHEDEVVAWVERAGPPDLREELQRFREGRARGLVGELPLLRAAFSEAHPRTARMAAPGGGERERA